MQSTNSEQTSTNTYITRDTLGIVMAKGVSRRCPDKNIADIAGKPAFAHAIDILRASGICNSVIVSTDDEQYATVAHDYADGVVLREEGWDDFPYFSLSVNNSRKAYETKTGAQFTNVAYIGGNNIFTRPSWFRTALRIMDNYLYNEMPIDLIVCDTDPTGLGLSRINREGCIDPTSFVLHHSGIKCDFDFPFELELAKQLMTAISKRVISYPLDETWHDDILNYQNHNHFRGLTKR